MIYHFDAFFSSNKLTFNLFFACIGNQILQYVNVSFNAISFNYVLIGNLKNPLESSKIETGKQQ